MFRRTLLVWKEKVFVASNTQFNGKRENFSLFSSFFCLLFFCLFCIFFTYNSSVGDQNCCGVDWVGPQTCVLDCCHQSGKYLFLLCPLLMLYYNVWFLIWWILDIRYQILDIVHFAFCIWQMSPFPQSTQSSQSAQSIIHLTI